MECTICPVREECNSARRVAIISMGEGTDGNILYRVNNVCPLEEMMYATFSLAIHNAKMEAGDVQ